MPAGGGNRVRTGDLLLAKQMLYQLSYTPDRSGVRPSAWPGPSQAGLHLGADVLLTSSDTRQALNFELEMAWLVELSYVV